MPPLSDARGSSGQGSRSWYHRRTPGWSEGHSQARWNSREEVQRCPLQGGGRDASSRVAHASARRLTSGSEGETSTALACSLLLHARTHARHAPLALLRLYREGRHASRACDFCGWTGFWREVWPSVLFTSIWAVGSRPQECFEDARCEFLNANTYVCRDFSVRCRVLGVVGPTTLKCVIVVKGIDFDWAQETTDESGVRSHAEVRTGTVLVRRNPHTVPVPRVPVPDGVKPPQLPTEPSISPGLPRPLRWK